MHISKRIWKVLGGNATLVAVLKEHRLGPQEKETFFLGPQEKETVFSTAFDKKSAF